MPFYRATHPENTEVRGPSFVSPTVKPPSTGNSLLQQILKTWWSRLKRSMRHKTAHALHSNRIVFWATAIGQLCPESGYAWTGNQRKASKCSCRNSVQHKNQVIKFLIKQRLSLPASVSEALEEAWVPSAPQWLLHTTACPSKCHQDSRISKDFCMKRKKMQVSQQCCRDQSVSVAELWVNVCLSIAFNVTKPKPKLKIYFPWLDQYITPCKPVTHQLKFKGLRNKTILWIGVSYSKKQNLSISVCPTGDLRCSSSPLKSQQPFLSVFHKHHTSHINLYKINHAERIPPQETDHASTKERHQAASVSRIRSGLLKTQMAPNTSVPLKVLPLHKNENCVPGSVITHLTVWRLCGAFYLSCILLPRCHQSTCNAWVGWTQPFNYLPKESGSSPPQLENKPKTAGHNNENSTALVYQFSVVSHTFSNAFTPYLVCNLYQCITRSVWVHINRC